jgi:hypothetical protein
VAHNGTAVRIRGSSVKAPRQPSVGLPAATDDDHSGGLGMTNVARGSVAVVEVGRPAIFSPMGLVFLRAWSYLRFVIQQARNPRWAAAHWRPHARNVAAVRSRRQKVCPGARVQGVISRWRRTRCTICVGARPVCGLDSGTLPRRPMLPRNMSGMCPR